MREWVLRGAAIVALTSLVLEFGFPLTPTRVAVLHSIDLAVAAILIGDVLWRLHRSGGKVAHLRAHWIEFLALALVAAEIGLAIAAGVPAAFAGLYVIGAQAYLIVRLVLAAVRANEKLAATRLRPAWVLVGGFLILILFGTLLLLLPNCHAAEAAPWTLLDAFFTATSAACVTGLTVRDVGTDLSFRGQVVLLALIQTGGLGIVTLTMFLTYVQSRTLQLRQMIMIRGLLSIEGLGDVGRFLVHALVVTLLAELLGAAVLFHYYAEPGLGIAERAWWGLFHSVSAFCNAGFGLSADSFMRQSGNPPVLLMICALVIAGGIGFPVINDLLHVEVGGLPWYRRRRWSFRFIRRTDSIARLSLNTKLVLTATLLLLGVGTLLFALSEQDRTLAGLAPGERATAAFFQAVMPRTAGFNSVEMSSLGDATLLLLMVLMVIGASPVSTGGGIKTTSFLILALTLRAILHSRETIDAFGRSIPRRALNTAVSICILYGLAFLGLVTVLLTTQPQLGFLHVAFESVSALSTVGLSIGVTGAVDPLGRFALCAAMLFGRVGPLAVALSVISQPDPLRYQYPEEGVVVS